MPRVRVVPALLALVAILAVPVPGSAQFGGLMNAGTVSATVGGGAVSVNVSIAVLNEEGTLVLTALTNDVQIQIPDARVGTYEFALDADGGLVGPLLSLRANGRMITPVSGSISIESLTGEAAAGSFAFEGVDLETDTPVTVTGGRFDVRFTGGG